MATTSPQPSDTNEPSSKKVKFSDDTIVGVAGESQPSSEAQLLQSQETSKDGMAANNTVTNNGITPAKPSEDATPALSSDVTPSSATGPVNSAPSNNNNNANITNNNSSSQPASEQGVLPAPEVVNGQKSVELNQKQQREQQAAIEQLEHEMEGDGIGDHEEHQIEDEEEVESESQEFEESDVDPKIKECLEDVEAIQNEIENLNEKASEEILKVEQKYNKLRKPFYDRRNELLKNIPNFWIGTFVNNANISAILDEEDEECLHYLTKVDVEEFEDIKSGFRIKFHFAPNPYFTNDVLVKEFHCADGTDEPLSKSTPINFKCDFEPAQRLKAAAEQGIIHQENQRQHHQHHDVGPRTFFSWFMQQSDASSDDIAEIIKEELWPNPLQYYLMSDGHGGVGGVGDDVESDEDDDDDDEEDDDDDDEDDDDEEGDDEEDDDAVVIEQGHADDDDDEEEIGDDEEGQMSSGGVLGEDGPFDEDDDDDDVDEDDAGDEDDDVDEEDDDVEDDE